MMAISRPLLLFLLIGSCCFYFTFRNSQQWRFQTETTTGDLRPAKDDWLAEIRKAYNVPALAAGHVNSKGWLRLKVTGSRRRDRPSITVTVHDQWHLGSLTKAMTSTLIALLIKDNLFSWNTTLGELFPDFPMDPAHRSTSLAAVTSHRAGLSVELTPALVAELYDDNLSARDGRWLLVEKALVPPPPLPKYQFKYENTDYIIAGSIIDRYSGSTWEEFIEDRLFKPLGMSGCGFGPSEERSAFSIDNPWPHFPTRFGPVPVFLPFKYRDNPRPLSSAGTVHCPIESYAKFLKFHADTRSGKVNALGLSSDDMKSLHTPIWVDEGSKFAYTPGGWNRNVMPLDPREDGDYVITHQGSNTRNLAESLLVVPKEGPGEVSVAFTNVGDAEDGISEVMAGIAKGYLSRG